MSWTGGNHENENVSDFKDVTGQHPAVLGQDFHYYVYKSADERRKHKEAALKAYALGCVVTFDFHMFSKYHQSTDYTASDRYLMYNIGEQNNAYGELAWFKNELNKAINVINELKIPVVVRLFHEMNGHWFWWGTNAYGGTDSYKKMYRVAVNHIKANTNYALFAWSPNYPFNTSYYPGNNYVDVVGLDMYDQGTNQGQSFGVMVNQLETLVTFAEQNYKIPVFAETGNRINSPDAWFYWWYNVNENIQNSSKAYRVAWMLTWINRNWNNPPYVAYSGSSYNARKALSDFKNMSTTLTQQDAANRNMYNYSYRNSALKSTQIEEATAADNTAKILIYPNPANGGVVNVDLTNFQDVDVSIFLFDAQGRKVINKGNIKNTPYLTLNVSELNSGVYFVKITGSGVNETQKIVIQ